MIPAFTDDSGQFHYPFQVIYKFNIWFWFFKTIIHFTDY